MSSDTGPSEEASLTIVVPTRDRPELLQRCLRSLATQSFGGITDVLVVVDGGAVDHTAESVAAANPTLVATVIPNTRTPGPAGARNTGLLAATGQFVAFCDDDDEWLHRKAALQIDLLRRTPTAFLCGTGVKVVSDGRVVERGIRSTISRADLERSRCMELNPTTMLARRTALAERVGLFDEEIPAGRAEDYDLFLRASEVAPIVNVPIPLAIVHRHYRSTYYTNAQGYRQAHEYLLTKHSATWTDQRGRARIIGKMAIASTMMGERREARATARRALRINPTEPRAYLALLARQRPAFLCDRALGIFGRSLL